MPRADTRFFIVPGRPKGKQRPRLAHGRVYTPRETIEYEAKIREHYLDLYSDKEPFGGDVAVDVFAFFKTRTHPDLDNIVKTLDALNKVAWFDDKQVKQINAYLIVDKEQEERLVVIIRPVSKTFSKKVLKKLEKHDTRSKLDTDIQTVGQEGGLSNDDREQS